ncbi:MAG: FAD-dependent oxidoreductase [Clostridiales bacterium]
MAIIKKYKSIIIEKHQLSSDVFSLVIKSLGKPFKYHPGQFLHLALDAIDFSEQWPESRCFSIQSSPSEDNIKITFAVKGRFTKRMVNEIFKGSQVFIKLPYGDLFTQDHNRNNVVFIAGGTGVTPFLSLFSDYRFSLYSGAKLFLGLKKKELNFYSDLLDVARINNPDFDIKIYYEGINGFISVQEVIEHDNNDNVFFISGPPMMIKYYKNELTKNNISIERIITDDWE